MTICRRFFAVLASVAFVTAPPVAPVLTAAAPGSAPALVRRIPAAALTPIPLATCAGGPAAAHASAITRID